MAVAYSTAAKGARMTATRHLLNGGALQPGTVGIATVLASISLHPGAVFLQRPVAAPNIRAAAADPRRPPR
jgi:hypothetical protein